MSNVPHKNINFELAVSSVLMDVIFCFKLDNQNRIAKHNAHATFDIVPEYIKRSLVASVLAYYIWGHGSNPRWDTKTKLEKYFFGDYFSTDFSLELCPKANGFLA